MKYAFIVIKNSTKSSWIELDKHEGYETNKENGLAMVKYLRTKFKEISCEKRKNGDDVYWFN